MAANRADAQEREYRAAVMDDLRRRIATSGAHAAKPHADRARQFMPFAALKGYHELAHNQEAVTIPKPELSEERLAELSEATRGLCRGDDVRVAFYEGGQRVALRGRLAKVDEAAHAVFVGKKRIPIENILDIGRAERNTP